MVDRIVVSTKPIARNGIPANFFLTLCFSFWFVKHLKPPFPLKFNSAILAAIFLSFCPVLWSSYFNFYVTKSIGFLLLLFLLGRDQAST